MNNENTLQNLMIFALGLLLVLAVAAGLVAGAAVANVFVEWLAS